MKQFFTQGYALLIGVGHCANYPKWSLPVTIKDALSIQSCLTDPTLCAYTNDDSHLRFLKNDTASRQDIVDGLTWLEEQSREDEEATAVIYFSGHGWLNNKTGQYYLVPSDVDPFNIPDSALAADDFMVSLRNIRAQRLLVVIDSCHSEGMAAAKDGSIFKLPPDFDAVAMPKSIAESLKHGEGRAVFTSSRGHQKSWVRLDNSLSIYTYHFIEALQGANNKPGETAVLLSNLMNHLSQTVPQSAQTERDAEQTPFFDMAAEDFAVALLRGGKGLPSGGVTAVQAETASFVQRVLAENQSKIRDVRQENSGESGSQIVEAKDNSTIIGVVQQIRK